MLSTSVGTCPACGKRVRLGLAVDPEDPPCCSLLAGDREQTDGEEGCGSVVVVVAAGVAEDGDEEGADGAVPDDDGGANEDGVPANERHSSTDGSSSRGAALYSPRVRGLLRSGWSCPSSCRSSLVGTSSKMSRYVPGCNLLVTMSKVQGNCRGASIPGSIFCRARANCSCCEAHRSKSER